MSIRRFFAKTTSEALRKVRDELGADAVILSNRTTDEGIEILALGPADIAALLPASEPESKGLPVLEESQEETPEESPVFKPEKEKTPPFTSMSKSRSETVQEADDGVKSPFQPYFFPSGEKRERETLRPVMSERQETPNPANELPLSPYASDEAEAAPVLPKKRRRAAVKNSSAGHTPIEKEGQVIRRAELQNESHSAVEDIARTASNENNPPLGGLRQVADEVAATVLKEIKSMRGTIEQQLAMLGWKEQERRVPARRGLRHHLQKAGFSDSLAREVANELPEGIDEKDAIKWAKTVVAVNIAGIGNESEILEKGGVYALVGPTGVGKTTTTAKLAARCVVRHGADKLALLTTDGYRIGGHEQLRIYGKILGVTVHAVKDAHDLTLALAELRGKHLVLIDTVGMGQRDRMVVEQVAMLAGCGVEVKRLLLLNAASNRHTLNEVAHAYRGGGLAGAIITKLDESAVLGCALDTVIRHRLPLYYTTCGQRVPEDLEPADTSYLVDRALDHLPSLSPFAELEEDITLSFTGREGAKNVADRSGVYLG